MREIKFRAWHDKWGWADPSDITLLGDGAGWVDYRRENGDKISAFVLADSHIMQYTGLKDKNGVEIYEGDIVVCVEMHDSNVFCDAWADGATWQDGTTKPIPKLIEKDKNGIDWKWFCDIRSYPEWWKVIGNIYENPELLEEK